jgi:hypothetical protein
MKFVDVSPTVCGKVNPNVPLNTAPAGMVIVAPLPLAVRHASASAIA